MVVVVYCESVQDILCNTVKTTQGCAQENFPKRKLIQINKTMNHYNLTACQLQIYNLLHINNSVQNIINQPTSTISFQYLLYVLLCVFIRELSLYFLSLCVCFGFATNVPCLYQALSSYGCKHPLPCCHRGLV
jgi:hypothetical protein